MSDLSLLHQQLAHWDAHGEIPMSSGQEHKVQENPYSVTLRRSSVKGGPQIVKAESMLEYDFYCVLDFDRRVEKYKEQPVVIPWRTPGGQYRRYTPDVLVKFRELGWLPGEHLRSTIFEVKPYQVLKDNWAKMRPKIRGVQKSLEGTCVPFKIITEKQLRPTFVKNVKFLLNYDKKRIMVNDRLSPKSYERLGAVQSALHGNLKGLDYPHIVMTFNDPTTPRELMNYISKDPMVQAVHVPWLWHMMREGDVMADLIEPLTMDSEIWTRDARHAPPKWTTKEYDWYR